MSMPELSKNDVRKMIEARTVKIDAISTLPSAFVARYSTLFPLRGFPPTDAKGSRVSHSTKDKLNNAGIIHRTSELIKDWDLLAEDLYKAGYKKLPEEIDLIYARTCRPNFVIAHPLNLSVNLKFCSLRAICPFCYSRVVEDVFDNINFVTKKTMRFSKHVKLIGFKYSVYTDLPETTSDADTATILRINMIKEPVYRRTLYSACQASAAYITSTLEPDEPSSFKIERRAIMLVDNSFDFLSIPEVTKPEEMRTWEMLKYDPLDVSEIVGSVLRYPVKLMTEIYIDRVIMCLEARSGLRLSSNTGLFRKTRENKEKSLPPVPASIE